MATLAELEERIRVLERRLEIVEDVEAIRLLKARYGELADSRYGPSGVKPPEELEHIASQIVQLFTEDAVWDGGGALGVCRGRQEIRDRFLKPTLVFSLHYFVKPQIQVNGQRARATWDILAPCTTKDGRPHWMAGLEHDEYEKQDGHWLHSKLELEVAFMAPHDRGWGRKPKAS